MVNVDAIKLKLFLIKQENYCHSNNTKKSIALI